jgi:hypothetical protein
MIALVAEGENMRRVMLCDATAQNIWQQWMSPLNAKRSANLPRVLNVCTVLPLAIPLLKFY